MMIFVRKSFPNTSVTR